MQCMTQCKVYVGIRDMNELKGLNIPSQDLKEVRKVTKLKIPDQIKKIMYSHFKNTGTAYSRRDKSSQNAVTTGIDNYDSDCVVVDVTTNP